MRRRVWGAARSRELVVLMAQQPDRTGRRSGRGRVVDGWAAVGGARARRRRRAGPLARLLRGGASSEPSRGMRWAGWRSTAPLRRSSGASVAGPAARALNSSNTSAVCSVGAPSTLSPAGARRSCFHGH